MRAANVLRNGKLVGVLSELENGHYNFVYDLNYLADPSALAVSLTLPKRLELFECPYLFPFFFNMLSEGVNRKVQSRQLKIDEDDHFGFLLQTARHDTIGAITIEQIEEL